MKSIWPKDIGEISRETSSKIAPAGWAFSIWGLIYLLTGSFTVYQLLPLDWVPDRNDTLIFGDLSFWFISNFLLNGIWIALFLSDTMVTFILAQMDMAIILVTCLWIMLKSSNAKVNLIEAITLRGGFTIYAGWITAAFIVSISQILYRLGMVDPNIIWGFNEENLSQIIAWIALIIYNTAAWTQRNPLFGAIYIWVSYAIKSELENKHPSFTSLIDTVTNIAEIQTGSMVVLLALLSAELIYGLKAPNGWENGLFYGM